MKYSIEGELAKEIAGKRIDSIIPKLDPTITRSHAQKMIRAQYITVNGKKTKTAYLPEEGDTIEVNSSIEETYQLQPIPGDIQVIFEDEHICLLDKPQGLTVHPSETSETETLSHYLLHRYPSIKNVGDHRLRPGIVHRLDKLTSGIMVVAKDQDTYATLKNLWKTGMVQKEYRALVWGDIEKPGSLSGKISRSKRTGRMVAKTDIGRDAVTLYAPLERFTTMTHVAIATHTGRTHQIRAHFKSIGQPIVGDPLYTYRKNKKIFPRLFLHANKISFPYGGERRTWESPLPNDFTEFMKSLKKKG